MKVKSRLSALIFFVLTLNSLYSFPIDLTKEVAFIRSGFQKEWVENFATESINFQKISPDPSEIRSILIGDFSERRVKNFFSIPDNSIEVFTIVIPFEWKEDLVNIIPALYLSGIGENWEISLNGYVIQREIHLSEVGQILIQRSLKKEIIPIQSSYFHTGVNILCFKIIGRPTERTAGLFNGGIQLIDDFTILNSKRLKSEISAYLVIPLIFFAGIFHLYLFIRTFRYAYQFYFASFLLVYSGYFFLQSTFAYILFYNTETILQLGTIALFFSELSLVYFLEYVFIEKISFVGKLNGIIILSLSALVAIKSEYRQFSYDIFYFLEISVSLWISYFVFISIRKAYQSIYQNYQYGNKVVDKINCFFRTMFTTISGNVSFGFLVTIIALILEFFNYYIFRIQTNLFLITISGFLIGMNLVLINKFELAVRSEVSHTIRIEEERKRFDLEKELLLARERESIFADIHDNLGGKLLDISLQFANIQKNTSMDFQAGERIRIQIKELIEGLRNRLFEIEDIITIEKDFIKGIEFFLLRRYVPLNRSISFKVDIDLKDRKISRNFYKQILPILQELVNNDLKYGKGITDWSLDLENRALIIRLNSVTDWEYDRISIGNGHKTIQQRAQKLGATFSGEIADGKYNGELIIPVGNSQSILL